MCKIEAPSPVGHGWESDGNSLTFLWMTKPSAPECVLNVVHCGCKKGCASSRCLCVQNSVACTELCKCTGCENVERVCHAQESDEDESDTDE